MLTNTDRSELAGKVEQPQRTISLPNLNGLLYWCSLLIAIPLSVPLMVLHKQLKQPFKKQRY